MSPSCLDDSLQKHQETAEPTSNSVGSLSSMLNNNLANILGNVIDVQPIIASLIEEISESVRETCRLPLVEFSDESTKNISSILGHSMDDLIQSLSKSTLDSLRFSDSTYSLLQSAFDDPIVSKELDEPEMQEVRESCAKKLPISLSGVLKLLELLLTALSIALSYLTVKQQETIIRQNEITISQSEQESEETDEFMKAVGKLADTAKALSEELQDAGVLPEDDSSSVTTYSQEGNHETFNNDENGEALNS